MDADAGLALPRRGARGHATHGLPETAHERHGPRASAFLAGAGRGGHRPRGLPWDASGRSPRSHPARGAAIVIPTDIGSGTTVPRAIAFVEGGRWHPIRGRPAIARACPGWRALGLRDQGLPDRCLEDPGSNGPGQDGRGWPGRHCACGAGPDRTPPAGAGAGTGPGGRRWPKSQRNGAPPAVACGRQGAPADPAGVPQEAGRYEPPPRSHGAGFTGWPSWRIST